MREGYSETQAFGGGVQRKYQFQNGYGASVVRSPFSYGGSEGKWELAVFKDGNICYGTPIMDDVIGHLDDAGVDALLEQIEKLPPIE